MYHRVDYLLNGSYDKRSAIRDRFAALIGLPAVPWQPAQAGPIEAWAAWAATCAWRGTSSVGPGDVQTIGYRFSLSPEQYTAVCAFFLDVMKTPQLQQPRVAGTIPPNYLDTVTCGAHVVADCSFVLSYKGKICTGSMEQCRAQVAQWQQEDLLKQQADIVAYNARHKRCRRGYYNKGYRGVCVKKKHSNKP